MVVRINFFTFMHNLMDEMSTYVSNKTQMTCLTSSKCDAVVAEEKRLNTIRTRAPLDKILLLICSNMNERHAYHFDIETNWFVG